MYVDGRVWGPDYVFLGPEAVRPVCESEYGEEGSRVETTDDCRTEAGIELSTLEEEIAELRTHNATLEAQVSSLSDNLDREKGRVNEIWRVNCAQVALFDEMIAGEPHLCLVRTLRSRSSRPCLAYIE